MKATQSQHRMEEIAMARILTRFKEDYSAMLSSTRFECGDACTKRPGDLPVGLFAGRRVQPLLQKYSDFPKKQISLTTSPSTPLEGRIAIVTDAGLDAVAAEGAQDERAGCGR